MAIGLLLGFPTGVPVAGELQNLQTGDGEFNQMIQLDAGKGFKIGKLNAYTSLYAGFNHRTKGYSEEIRFGAELGMVFLKEKLWFIVRSNGVESLKNGLTAQNMSSTGIFANNTEYISIAAELNYYLTKKIGFSASFAGAFRGEIIAAAPSYSAGVFLDLSR